MTENFEDNYKKFNLDFAKSSLLRDSVQDRDSDLDDSLKAAEQVTHKYREDIIELHLDSIRLSHEDQKDNRRMRWNYSQWVFSYLVCYSMFVFVLLIFDGFEQVTFDLPASVLEFLVGSTAVSSIGLVAAVVAGLFNKREK
ncbi:hypothetical protein [Falsiruegeria litorea]|uniref:hypothetical protein n=1 Tax=Falsiruegeria litorea TaxID=1280831 RepID=UPI001056909E|nr:hypothetical protein [Falsiruegeria litorea]